MTNSDSVSDGPRPAIEQTGSAAQLNTIIDQLATIIELLQAPIREKEQRQQDERRTADAFGEALRNYAQGNPE